MKPLKICTAIRDKNFEDSIIKQIEKLGHQYSTVTIDDIVNGARSDDLIFIVEDSYKTILDLIEFHNTCPINFIPVIFLTDSKSQHKNWVREVRYSYKYYPVEAKLLPFTLKRIVETFDELRSSKLDGYIASFQKIIVSNFTGRTSNFRDSLDTALHYLLDFIFAERGSIMLLNDKGNLVIEAASKRGIVGIEVPYEASSVSWTVMETKEPLFVEDITKDNRFAKRMQMYSKDYFMSMPIFIKGEIKGVLNLSDKMVSLLFDRTDLTRANAFLSMLEPLLLLNSMNEKCAVLLSEREDILNSKDQSIDMLVHDIKLPLSSIKGNLEIIKMSSEGESMMSQFIETAIASCEDINLMVNSLIDLHKMKDGKMTVKTIRMPVNSIISDIVNNFSAYAQLSNVDILTEFNRENLEISTDPSLLSRILGNMIVNSLKNMDNTRKGKIIVSAEDNDGKTIIKVKDNGVGIPEEKKESIFDIYFSSYNDSGSHGLGLAFVKQAVEIMGGTITVISEPGDTVFTITFD